MPSKDGDPVRRKSRREEESLRDSPRAKDKDRDYDRERERPTLKKKHLRRRSSPDPAPRGSSPDASRLNSRSSMSDLPSRTKTSSSSAVPEMSRRVSLGESKLNAYPAFSKEHSREAVRPAEEQSKSKLSPTTADGPESSRSESVKRYAKDTVPEMNTRRPPSPLSTSDEAEVRRTASASSRRSQDSHAHDSARESAEYSTRIRNSHLKPSPATSPRKSSKGDSSDPALRHGEGSRSTGRRQGSGVQVSRGSIERDRDATATTDSQSTPTPLGRRSPAPVRQPTTPGTPSASRGDTTTPRPSNIYTGASPRSDAPASRMAMPTSHSPYTTQHPGRPFAPTSANPSTPSISLSSNKDSLQAHRVDYLLLNGGLPHLIPRSLIPGSKPPAIQTYQQYTPPAPANITNTADAANVFSSISRRLDDLDKILSKNGSVAVATGYRSVARRLLDRLEHVFARNISSEKCTCALCQSMPDTKVSDDDELGVSWGEILEFVSGRRELPPWPPFTFDASTGSINLDGRIERPMQKLDPDVPDEFRQHYMRQNDKTKKTIHDWLATQTEDTVQTDPPRDVDDETLAFAMSTRLDIKNRQLFTALMKGKSTIDGANSSNASATPEPHNDTLEKTSLALQRLYRLNTKPRKPESTLFLMKNPQLHGVLATLAAISPGEWDILVSGRFDGFLWSGADPQYPPTANTNPSQVPPRGTTPLSRVMSPLTQGSPAGARGSPFSTLRNQTISPGPLRGATPFSMAGSSSSGQTPSGVPVQLDEETEISVLSEIERSIYRDMELLEDAFENLHQRAELIRNQLRSRATGLSQAAQARHIPDDSGAVPVVPAPSDVDLDDRFSELAPDDSASNISSARRSRRGAERRAGGMGHMPEGGTAADRRRRR